MLRPLFFLLPTEDKQFINSFSSPLYRVHTDFDSELQEWVFLKNTQSRFSPFLGNFNRLRILWHCTGSLVIVIVLLQTLCGCEPSMQCSDDLFQESHCQAGRRNDLCILHGALFGLEQWYDKADLNWWSTKFWYPYLENWCLHFSSIMFWGDFFFLYLCCCWGLLLVLEWISPHCSALHLSLLNCTCMFQTFSSVSQDHSQRTNSFFCYHILFLSN